VACRAATKKAPHRRGALGKGDSSTTAACQVSAAVLRRSKGRPMGGPGTVFACSGLGLRDNRPCGILVTLGKCFRPITLLGDFPVRMSQSEHAGVCAWASRQFY